MKDWFLVGEFSKITGLSLKALRLYEEKGLLIPRERGDNKYRYFSSSQIEEAKRIVQFKELGFTLEQIKRLLTVTAEETLYELVKKKVAESKSEAIDLSLRIQNLESLLSSLEKNKQLTEEQRGVLMESVFEASLNNLKRRGVVADSELITQLKSEVDHFSEDVQKLLPEIRQVLKIVKQKNILIGPGRANTAASLVLFSEGYSPFDPRSFDLMPETFSQSKIFMFDVEYSNSDILGLLCDEITKKINFEVVAFKSPFLDILKDVQIKTGEIDFEKFSDLDPIVLEAPKRSGTRGLFGPDWSPDFEAFRTSSPEFQAEHNYRENEIEELYKDLVYKNLMDYINTETIRDFHGLGLLKTYLAGGQESAHTELQKTNGLLLYREDWLKIYMRLTGVGIAEANSLLSSIRNNPQDHSINSLSNSLEPVVKSSLYEAIPDLYSKSHAVSWWWYYKRTAILKALWKDSYLDSIKKWEDQHQMIWQEFGYKKDKDLYYLKA
ncbi:MAG: MerR family transcriptional regulator [Bdellovibrio sp.]